ncbi:major facilitator superfamily domain-containing protein [Fomitopsis betulina]|nr:major facilitator superfamily domain-containing protein [Fomitopsis betulina]
MGGTSLFTMPRHTSPPRDSDSTPTVPEPIVEPRQSREAVVMGSWKVAIALVVLSAGYYLNMLIMLDVVIDMQYQTEYTRQNLIRMWDALLVGQFIGQVVMGALCDAAGCSAALCASTIILLLGGILCVTARSISESPSRIMWFLTIARGIIGVGIGGVYPSASTMVIEGTQEGPRSGQDFVMITNTVFTAGGPLASVIFLIVLSAAQPQHLDTVWPVCIGIGIVLPIVALCCCGWQMLSSRYKHHALQSYAAELRQHWLTILRVGFFWLIYDFVAVPKIVFSGLILFTILDGHLWRTAGFELLLGAFALAGSITGAMLCDSFGRHKTLCISFVGYIVFALVIGCAYDRLVKIVPLFVVLYASMLFMGNMGPGNLLALMTAKSYPGPARGSLYGVTAAFGTAGAVAGIHAFSAIDENLRKQRGFIFVAICGLIGIILAACFLPQDPTSAGGEIPDLASDAVPVARPDGHRSSSSIGLDVDNKVRVV